MQHGLDEFAPHSCESFHRQVPCALGSLTRSHSVFNCHSVDQFFCVTTLRLDKSDAAAHSVTFFAKRPRSTTHTYPPRTPGGALHYASSSSGVAVCDHVGEGNAHYVRAMQLIQCNRPLSSSSIDCAAAHPCDLVASSVQTALNFRNS
eukprot:5697884-Amphidinium_carterae.1